MEKRRLAARIGRSEIRDRRQRYSRISFHSIGATLAHNPGEIAGRCGRLYRSPQTSLQVVGYAANFRSAGKLTRRSQSPIIFASTSMNSTRRATGESNEQRLAVAARPVGPVARDRRGVGGTRGGFGACRRPDQDRPCGGALGRLGAIRRSDHARVVARDRRDQRQGRAPWRPHARTGAARRRVRTRPRA